MNLRWYQKESVDAVWRYMRSEPGNPLIVLPTGAGKSLCVAELARQAIAWGGRAIVLAHRKELLEQNADKIQKLIPGLDVGIYSAGLKSRDTEHDVVCAGIQSCWKKAFEFGERKLVIIDECHLVPHKDVGMYRRFMDDILRGNEWLRFVGLTATPYRLSDGMLTDGDIWSEIVYEAPIRRMIDEGFLCNLTNTATTSIDTSQLHTRGGEFIPKEMEGAFLNRDKLLQVCREIVTGAAGRHSVLVFAAGVDHAHAMARTLHDMTGEEVACITGDTMPQERQSSIERFRSGQLRWMTNCDVLTVGFDSPNIDCIAVARATQSAGLFAQVCGRGFRVSPDKSDCLLLDFGNNLRRHGPLDSPSYGKAKYSEPGSGETNDEGNSPFKTCPQCKTEQHLSNRWCDACAYRFPEPEINVEEEADNESKVLAEPIILDVVTVELVRHPGKKGKQDTLRINYEIDCLDPGHISEWVCVEHVGWARSKAFEWWKEHSMALFPATIDEAIELWQRGALRSPIRLTVQRDGRWWRVLCRTFTDERPETWRDEDDAGAFDPFAFDDEEIPF